MFRTAKLHELKEHLSALKPGETALISNQELVAAEIPQLAGTDLRSRAEWLEKQLPFPCEIRESTDARAFTFRRSHLGH
jgi:hypothetical protein